MHRDDLDLGWDEEAYLQRFVADRQHPADQTAGEADRELPANLAVGEQVPVGVQGDAGRRVAELLLDRLDAGPPGTDPARTIGCAVGEAAGQRAQWGVGGGT